MASTRPRLRYTPLPPDAASLYKTRLLELLPEPDSSAVIKCQLHMASLQQKPSYEAISYCWGDPSLSVPILCNGYRLDIPTSLHDALRRLRDPKNSRMLWADAICIKQGPDATQERTQQVQMMRYIFQTAKRVIVWLGNAHSDSQVAIDLIRKFIKAEHQISEIDYLPYLKDEDLEKAGLPSSLTAAPWLSLRALFQRPWFYRIWVVQEVAVAASVEVTCGTDAISWGDLISGMRIGTGILISKRAISPDTVDFLRLTDAARYHFHKTLPLPQEYSPYNFEGALNYLAWFRRRDATDQRDKAFALHGLISSKDNRTQIVTDYGLHVEQVYRDAAVNILVTSRNLDILSIPRGETNLGHALPSWVADWSDSSNKTISLVGQIGHRFAASKGSCATPTFADGQRNLTLEGQIIDRIAQIAPVLQHANSSPAPFSSFSNALQQFSTNLEDLSQNQGVLLEWERLALAVQSSQYVTGESHAVAFEQTLIAGLLPGDNIYASYQDWRHNEPPRKFLHRLNVDSRPWLFKMACIAQLGLDAVEKSNPQKKQYTTMAYGRRFARTGKGYIALVPSQTQIGDSIALCKGGQTPLVFRAISEFTATWKLLGDSYVYGIMNGEEFKEDKCTNIRIV